MEHLPLLVKDLALILIVAGIVTLVFKWLKQPVVLGYIVAGFFVSPYFIALPNIADPENIKILAEIGVIFLLFTLGLEFSFKKLFSVGKTAVITTITQMIALISAGFIAGQMFGWPQLESFFLGGMIASSSTTIIIKTFEDLGLKKKKFAQITFGVLIVEDLLVILLMVLLSTIAVSRDFEGINLVISIIKLVFFVAVWFISGIVLIPTLIKKIKHYLNDETLLIVSCGLCFGMVIFANVVGFSSTLGAFIIGSILAETIEAKRIEHLIEPLKSLFGAVFFVSVGMMIVPGIIVEYITPILVISILVVVINIIFGTIGVSLAGENLKVAMQTGFSLAQIGEFSFIIATLGVSLGVINDFMYPVIVTVSVITTLISPFAIKGSVPAYNKVIKIIPVTWTRILNGNHLIKKQPHLKNEFKIYIKKIISNGAIYSIISAAIIILSRQFLYPLMLKNLNWVTAHIVYAGVTILLMSPFLNFIMRAGSENRSFSNIKDAFMNADAKYKFGIIIIRLFQIAIPIILIAIVVMPIFPKYNLLMLGISIAIAILIVVIQIFNVPKQKITQRFIDNFNDTSSAEIETETFSKQFKSDLNTRSIHIERVTVPQNSPQVGKTLRELDFRKKTGTSIVSIIRGNEIINIPDKNTRLYPFDKVIIVGSDEEVDQFVSLVEKENKEQIENDNTDVSNYWVELYKYHIEEDSLMIGQTIGELDVQKKTGCLITGIERNNKMINRFEAHFKFKANDILWLAGEKHNLAFFVKSLWMPTEKKYTY